MFLLCVDLARCDPAHEIVVGGGHELLLHYVDHIHRRHDRRDVAVHL
ncbi:hypothetical protein [Rhizobium rhizosphaerae]|nr:hypothetical protein [Xaviernesmea rhizosphaerae]